MSLGLFAWLLTLHPTAAGRVYAAYGGVYIGVALLWLMVVDKVQPTATDWIGISVCFSRHEHHHVEIAHRRMI